MKLIKFTMAALALSALAACGGGDTEDRLDIADPKVRFIDADQASPTVTLYREEVAQSDATSVAYKFASKYIDVSPGTANWSIRATAIPGTKLAEVNFDAKRGDRNTIISLLGTATGTAPLLIDDPYNKGLTSDKARVRIANAAANTQQGIDVYMTGATDDISARTPDFANVQYTQAVPASGSDSIEFNGGDYRLRITQANTKTVIFDATVSILNNSDWLLVPIPTAGSGVLTPNDIKILAVKGNDTDAGTTTEITTTPQD